MVRHCTCGLYIVHSPLAREIQKPTRAIYISPYYTPPHAIIYIIIYNIYNYIYLFLVNISLVFALLYCHVKSEAVDPLVLFCRS